MTNTVPSAKRRGQRLRLKVVVFPVTPEGVRSRIVNLRINAALEEDRSIRKHGNGTEESNEASGVRLSWD